MKNIVIQIIIGFFLADFLSGFFHWIEDNYIYYCIDIPMIRVISKGNEMHHYFPRAILIDSYFQNMLIITIITIIIFGIIYLINRQILFDYKYLFITLFIFLSISSIIHRFSHMKACEKNKYILFLQNVGIITSNEHHRIHHIKSDEKYCMNTPYLNLILDSIYFWRFLEFIIYIIFGLKTTKKGKYDDYKQIHTEHHIETNKECPTVINKNDLNILYNKLNKFKKCN